MGLRSVVSAVVFGLTATVAASNAATVHPTQFDFHLERGIASYDGLKLSSDAVSLLHSSPYSTVGTLDDMKRRAALQGFVALAAVGFETKQSAAPVQKSQRQADAEAAIAAMNVNMIMAIFIGLSAALMWLGLSLQREAIDK